jgi:hypothetical protein
MAASVNGHRQAQRKPRQKRKARRLSSLTKSGGGMAWTLCAPFAQRLLARFRGGTAGRPSGKRNEE